MTEQDAVKYIKQFIDDTFKEKFISSKTLQSFQMAISALEKQIPKKPKQRTVKEGIITTNYECPVCGCRRLGHGYNLDKCYCPECGQKLDWSDKNAM